MKATKNNEKLLDFGFLECEDILEATVPDGFIHIYKHKPKFFKVSAFYKSKNYDNIGGEHQTIYEALDAANGWWQMMTRDQTT